MGKKGLELVESYPTKLTESELDKIIFQSIPFGAQDGDFATRTVEDKVICGYIFSLPAISQKRANIATLTIVFDSMDFDSKLIKDMFSFMIESLKNRRMLSINLLREILSQIFDGLINESLYIEISNNFKIEFSNKNNDKKKKTLVDNLSKDVW